MTHSLLRQLLPGAPAALTAFAIGFGLTADAAESARKQPPRDLPVALLSDAEAAERSELNTDPCVMGEVELVRERYDNGAIHIERQTTLDRDGNYVNHGTWKMFSQGGDVIAEGHYHFGKRVGNWTRWHGKNDSEMFKDFAFREFKAPFMSQVNYTDGQMDGEWMITDANDRKVSQISLKDGKRHGMAIAWLPNENTYRQATYENGTPVGEVLELNPKTGKVERVAVFTDGRKIVSKTAYHSGSKQQKKSEVQYLGPQATQEAADDFWNARVAKYNTEGKNVRHGVSKAWYPNGKLESEGTYQFGKKSGTFTFWHENGQVASAGDYRDDKAEGQWVWWHENGQRSAYGRYDGGELTGEWRWWNENGKLTKQQEYDGTEAVSADSAPAEEALDISSRSIESAY